jgi:hypothetical protein
VVWQFKHIISHVGPLKSGNVVYKGSLYNLVIECETAETTSEHLNPIAADNTMSLELY